MREKFNHEPGERHAKEINGHRVTPLIGKTIEKRQKKWRERRGSNP
jgi:hypothetical protein